MKIGIPKEILEGERRVAVIPKMVEQLRKAKHEVYIEKDAGKGSFFLDSEYEKAGALITPDATDLYAEAEVILKIHPLEKFEVELMKTHSTCIGFLFADFKDLMLYRL